MRTPRARKHLSTAVMTIIIACGVVTAAAATPCDTTGGDAFAVASARVDVKANCDCASATNHGSYVDCARDVVRRRVDDALLSRACGSVVARCARHSTC